ncbi:MAG: UDP-glucose 4-epimerase GalE [Bacteroidetes bacterium]|nr:UDP-glucose 4-epimerase GalE [Bacteroidota bacterium]
MKAEILVTGGAGFIGSHTVVALHEAGYSPIILDNFSNTHPQMIEGISEIIGFTPTVYRVDCSDWEEIESVFKKHQFRGVIHFAAYKSVAESVAHPEMYEKNNMQTLNTILRAIREFGVSNLVFSSSATVYGQPECNPVNEATPWKEAASPYGWTKQQGELLIQSFSKQFEMMRAALLRYFNPIGAHPSGLIGEYPIGIPNNLIPLVNQAALGLRDLKVFGTDYATPDGTCIRDYIHVMDLAWAHVKALEWLDVSPPAVHVFNLGQGKGDSVLEILKMYQEENQVTITIAHDSRRPGDVESIWADVSKAENVLVWKTNFSTREALKHAYAFAKRIHI